MDRPGIGCRVSGGSVPSNANVEYVQRESKPPAGWPWPEWRQLSQTLPSQPARLLASHNIHLFIHYWQQNNPQGIPHPQLAVNPPISCSPLPHAAYSRFPPFTAAHDGCRAPATAPDPCRHRTSAARPPPPVELCGAAALPALARLRPGWKLLYRRGLQYSLAELGAGLCWRGSLLCVHMGALATIDTLLRTQRHRCNRLQV